MKTTRQDTRLDPFIEHYAARTQGLRVFAIRALLAVANQPEIVSLAGGTLNIKNLFLGEISDYIARVIRNQDMQVTQYGSGRGEPRTREQVREVMVEESSVVDPDDIAITAGSQQGLDLIIRVFYNPGGAILAESPSYVRVLDTFQSYQTEVVHVVYDSEGLIPEVLTKTAEHLKKQGRRARFLYVISNFNNPSGVTQPVERRHRVIESCAEAGVSVVEDNPHRSLTLDFGPLPAMRSLDTDVVYLGSFSKTFAPGLRVSWVRVPHGVRERLVLAQESTTLCPPVFSQFTINNYLENCDWRGQIGAFRNMYHTRRDATLTTLEREMPDGCFRTRSAGGFPVWTTLPEGLDVSTMLPRGVGVRVAFVPGPAFFANRQGSRNVRLFHCFPPPDRIATGVERLAQVLRSELEMLRTFGMHTPLHANPTKGSGPNPNRSYPE